MFDVFEEVTQDGHHHHHRLPAHALYARADDLLPAPPLHVPTTTPGPRGTYVHPSLFSRSPGSSVGHPPCPLLPSTASLPGLLGLVHSVGGVRVFNSAVFFQSVVLGTTKLRYVFIIIIIISLSV